MLQATAEGWTHVQEVAKRRGLLFALALGFAVACSPGDSLESGLGPTPGATLSVAIDGLPPGASAAVEVSSPQGFQRSLSSSGQLSQLAPGNYLLTAREIVAAGDHYVPDLESQNLSLSKGATLSVHVGYVLTTARLRIELAGVPVGTTAALSLTGPGGFQQSLSQSTVLAGLMPGTYSLAAPALIAGGDRYQTSSELTQLVLPVPDTIPVTASISYAITSGRLVLQISGAPDQASPSVHVTGPGLDRFITERDTLFGLTPAVYSVSAANLVSGGETYAPTPGELSVTVSADPAPAVARIAYGLSTGALEVTATGLPAGAAASINVTGPSGFAQSLSGTQLIVGLAPGSYTIAAGSVSVQGLLYLPSPGLQTRVVAVALTPEQVTVSYALAGAGLNLSVTGLPAGTSASLTLTGPGGYSASFNGSQSLSGLAAGSYHLSAASVSAGGFAYAAQPATQDVALNAGQSGSLTVNYAPVTGALSVSIGGLPGSVAAAVTVSGPGGYVQSLTASQTLTSLAPGGYAVSAAGVTGGGFSYSATPSSQSVAVVAGSNANASLSYSTDAGGLDLTINGAYLTQAVQRYDGSVPLVAGRDAYLRVFALANQANSAQPQVRVRLYNGPTLLQTYTLPAAGGSVPQASDESSLGKSWNVLVPAALVQPGLRLLADVDPAGSIAETDKSNNQFPVSGAAASIDVRALPTFAVRMVPVLQQANGLQGDVSGANKESFLADLKRMLPVGAYDAELRAPYTTTAPALQSNDGNGAWNSILSELLALRAAEGSARYYYGVVKVNYGSGIAGLGYVGGGAHTAMGWDYLPSAANVMAHEVGHNLGRWHAPCGGAGSPDPSYPYPGGQIGAWGLDVTTLALKAPTAPDLMGYCGPSWVSDYNWSGMVGFRQGGPNNAPESGAGASGLLVWGRVGPSGLVLEPAFAVTAVPEGLPRPGAERLELLGADGSLLRSIPFEIAEVADLPGATERAFAFVLPLSAREQATLGALRVHAQGRTATSRPATTADPNATISRIGPQQIELRWDATRFPVVLVRDAASGEVLSFARGGAARIWSRAQDFELQFSNGARPISRATRILR